ncbi:pre-RNA processing PIH1/Nop17-domain-containing protein, partial [Lactifluus volemus]
INVSPSPGFCIKSRLLQPGILNAISNLSTTSTANQSVQTKVPVPQGIKVFVNIAWSKDVPPPLDGVERAVELATHSRQMDLKSGQDTQIPVFVSDGRLNSDKAGNPALVFDCIYHSSLKDHGSKDAVFKSVLIELALQQIEAESSFSLSRVYGTPNIASKGTLEPRLVAVPATLFPPDHRYRARSEKTSTKKLIEEVADSTADVNGSKNLTFPSNTLSEGPARHNSSALETPTWTWTQDNREIRVMVHMPKLTRTMISSATLDLEPRRLSLLIPGLYALDIDLNLSTASLERESLRLDAVPEETETAFRPRRVRDFDIDGARAEWRVRDQCLVIMA